MLRRLFAGDPGPVREIVLANAAAALWTIAPVPASARRWTARRRAIDSGAAARLVERWSKLTRGEALNAGPAGRFAPRARIGTRIRTEPPPRRSPARRSGGRSSGWRARSSSSNRCST